jgi:hypothetical protein
MRKSITALFLFSLLAMGYGQKTLVWPVLSMTTYNENPTTGQLEPEFPSVLVSQYEGQEVLVTGYLIPVDVEANRYALSKNPFASCFFCGNAGPETVVELKFAEDPGRFATDKYLPIKGTLILNRKGSQLFFTLKNAQVAG